MVLILSFHLICDKVVKLVYNYNTKYFHRICATNYLFPRGVNLHVGCHITPQGAKKVIFTACHLGKLKITFTSPNIISTSPKNILMSRWISQFFCNFNSSRNFTCPLGKLITEFTSPMAKSTSPGYRTLISLHAAP